MNDQPNTNELVDHFFRHESANLVAALTRVFGFSKIDLVEDMVQAAMLEAMNSWRQKGVPDNPAGWLHRVARNRMLDLIRREKAHEKALAFAARESQEFLEQCFEEDSLQDSLLRMMFVCCHPSLDRKTQIALSLNILCGFNHREIARGLLLPVETIKKRIQRAKKSLAESNVALDYPSDDELADRLTAVQDVLYLLFNEGYSTTSGMEPIRDDVCEEAARLCHLLCLHPKFGTSKTKALLSLMLFHSSRLEARTDQDGNAILLEEQDRGLWDQDLIGVARKWLVKSADEVPSRFHFEAVIAQYHCVAPSLEETDWKQIVQFYDLLVTRYPSPIYRLNRAIAISQTGALDDALNELEQLRGERAMNGYYLLDCAFGRVHELAGNKHAATDSYLAALSNSVADHQKSLIKKRLHALSELPGAAGDSRNKQV